MANKANLANSVLFAPLSDSGTTLQVYTGDGSLFPAAPFYLTLSPKNKWSRKINSEIVLVTAKATDTFTITRAQKGTTAKEFSYGDLAAVGIYKEDLDDVYTSAVAAATSAALQAMMPVGFVVTLGVSTNPATLYGFGTWTRIQGRVIVGVSTTDGDFDLNDTGGAKTHTHLSGSYVANMQLFWQPNSLYIDYENVGVPEAYNENRRLRVDGTGEDSAHNEWSGGGVGVGGTSAASSSMSPYIAKYVWERTA